MTKTVDLNLFTNLALALFLAIFAGKLVKLIHLPNVTGYIIIGLVAGPYCLGILSADFVEELSFVADLALGFIAFSIGAEFKLSYLKKVGKTPVIIAICEALMAIVVVDLALILTGHDLQFSLVLGAIAAATAPAATLMVVRQYKAKGPVTQTLLPVVALDDAVALMGFGLSVAVAKAIGANGSVSLVETLMDPVIEILGGLLFGAFLGVIFRYLIKLFTGRGNRLAVSIAMVCLCLGISQIAGFNSLLGCMAMSAVLVNTSNQSDIIFEQLDRMTPPVFMLFFLVSGAELDLSILPTVGMIGILYIVFRVIGKVSGAYLGAKLSNASEVVKKYLGFTLIPQAGVAIGLATISMEVVPEYGGKIKAVILCGTIIYELFGPVITKFALMKAGEISTNKA